jgi:hypothetical protein
MPVVFGSHADLKDYLFRIIDNGGETVDRYTVAFSDGTYLALSSYPSHPQGFSQSGEDLNPAVMAEWVESGKAVDLALGDLPEMIRQHIRFRCNEGLADFLADVEAKAPKAVAANREDTEENDRTHTSLGKGIYWTEDGYRIKLDGAPEDDLGPFETAREAVIASLPDQYANSGPEYHTTVDDVMRMEPDEAVLAAVAALEATNTPSICTP